MNEPGMIPARSVYGMIGERRHLIVTGKETAAYFPYSSVDSRYVSEPDANLVSSLQYCSNGSVL
jgi:hypothetical protein